MIDPIRRARLQIESLLAKIGIMESERAYSECKYCLRKIAPKGHRKPVNWCAVYKRQAKAKCITFQQRAK